MCPLNSQTFSADRISSLPEFIKHQILSYLPPRYSIQTSVLSKGWHSTWKSFPILDFRQHPQATETLLTLIDNSLRRFAQRDLAIQKLFIDLFWIKEDFIPFVGAWFQSALRSGVSELFFHVSVSQRFIDDRFSFYYHTYHLYPVPEEAFSVAPSKGSFSKFFKLQNLSIDEAVMSEKIIGDITENCPNISNIVLERIHGLDSLQISGLHKLESLVITDFWCKRILVNAPSLKSFTYQELYWGTPKPFEIDLTACRALKYMSLNYCSISNDRFNISRFRFLETLFLFRCDTVQILMLSLPRLKVLSVSGCTIKSFHIDAPTLSEFTLRSDIGEFPLLSWNVLAHCKMIDLDLDVNDGTVMDSSWFVDLRRFLKTLTPGRINLQIRFDENMVMSFNPYIIGEAECSSLVRVEHLVIPSSPHSLESRSVLLDGLLWSCHPKVLSCTPFQAKILCKKFLRIRGRLCCRRINFKCWRHYMKAAKIDFIGNFSPVETNGGIEYEQFRLALDKNSIFNWGDAQFSLEWGYSTTTTLVT